MNNPFDDEDGVFHVLRNATGQYSLWPVFSPVPSGWRIELEAVGREEAIAYVDVHWTGLNPAGAPRQLASAPPAAER